MRSTRFPHRSQIDRKYNLSTHIHTDISHYCIAFSFSLSLFSSQQAQGNGRQKKNSVVLISTNDEDKRTSKKYGDKSAKKWRKGERGREGEKDERIEKSKCFFFFIVHMYVRMSTTHHSLSRSPFFCLTSVLVCLRFFPFTALPSVAYVEARKEKERPTSSYKAKQYHIYPNCSLSICRRPMG